MRLRLEDLPPKMRAQAERILAEEDERKRSARVPDKKNWKQDFDSRGEYEYYIGTVVPKMRKGEIVKCEQHPVFVLFSKGCYGSTKLREVRYTADFRLEYADGTIEIVEVKSKFVRRMQRDYPVRRRLFLEKYARPAGWKFTEVITADSRDDIRAWRRKKEEA